MAAAYASVLERSLRPNFQSFTIRVLVHSTLCSAEACMFHLVGSSD